MPTVHREAGYEFLFFAGDRGERPHVHVRGHGGFAKVWLIPNVAMQKGHGYTRTQVGKIIEIAEDHREEWLVAWDEFFARG